MCVYVSVCRECIGREYRFLAFYLKKKDVIFILVDHWSQP